jgi:hypothetical protein
MEKASPNRNTKAKFLQRLIDQVRRDPYFLGNALTKYEVLHGIGDKHLAEWLNCGLDSLTRLALCRMPDAEQDRFQQDTKRIAEFASCDADRLVQLLREVTAISSLRDDDRSSSGLLIAARDRRGQKHKTRDKDSPNNDQTTGEKS